MAETGDAARVLPYFEGAFPPGRFMRVLLHLRLRLAHERRSDLFAFLREATPTYEAPGGIKLRLLESRERPLTFIEVVEYDSVDAYTADQARVETNPVTQSLLRRWRQLLVVPPTAEAYDDVTAELTPRR